MEPALSLLGGWESFYVIIGSSAAALTGLQFVVVTLVAERRPAGPIEISAFATPTVVHFAAAFLLSAILSAPWRELSGPDLLVGAIGVAGVIYAIVIMARARKQTLYQPVLEDWLWHAALPFVAYGTLVAAAIALRHDPEVVLFVIGASSILLLFIGIHNAWDTVTWVLLDPSHAKQPAAVPSPPAAPAPDAPAAPAGSAAPASPPARLEEP